MSLDEINEIINSIPEDIPDEEREPEEELQQPALPELPVSDTGMTQPADIPEQPTEATPDNSEIAESLPKSNDPSSQPQNSRKSSFELLSLFSEEEIGPDPKEIKRREKEKKKEEEKKRKEEERKQAEEKMKQIREKMRKEEEERNKPPDDMERVVCYARERRIFPAGMPLDEIRKELSEEFWELTGDNVKMDWEISEYKTPEGNKEKRLIVRPVIAYAKKGC